MKSHEYRSELLHRAGLNPGEESVGIPEELIVRGEIADVSSIRDSFSKWASKKAPIIVGGTTVPRERFLEKMFAYAPIGYGRGEFLLDFIFDDVKLLGAGSSIDVEFSNGNIEVKTVRSRCAKIDIPGKPPGKWLTDFPFEKKVRSATDACRRAFYDHFHHMALSQTTDTTFDPSEVTSSALLDLRRNPPLTNPMKEIKLTVVDGVPYFKSGGDTIEVPIGSTLEDLIEMSAEAVDLLEVTNKYEQEVAEAYSNVPIIFFVKWDFVKAPTMHVVDGVKADDIALWRITRGKTHNAIRVLE